MECFARVPRDAATNVGSSMTTYRSTSAASTIRWERVPTALTAEIPGSNRLSRVAAPIGIFAVRHLQGPPVAPRIKTSSD